MRRRFLIVGTAAALAAAVLGLGGVLHGGGAAARGRPQADAATLASGFASGDTAGLVAQLQATLRVRPADVRSHGTVLQKRC